MNKKLLKVIIYPSQDGAVLTPSANEIIRKIGASKQTHKEEFSIINVESEEGGKILSIINALRETPVHIALWNPMPQAEIAKLINFNIEDIGNICLTSINHNVSEDKNEGKKMLPLKKEWEEFLQKAR